MEPSWPGHAQCPRGRSRLQLVAANLGRRHSGPRHLHGQHVGALLHRRPDHQRGHPFVGDPIHGQRSGTQGRFLCRDRELQRPGIDPERQRHHRRDRPQPHHPGHARPARLHASGRHGRHHGQDRGRNLYLLRIVQRHGYFHQPSADHHRHPQPDDHRRLAGAQPGFHGRRYRDSRRLPGGGCLLEQHDLDPERCRQPGLGRRRAPTAR